MPTHKYRHHHVAIVQAAPHGMPCRTCSQGGLDGAKTLDARPMFVHRANIFTKYFPHCLNHLREERKVHNSKSQQRAGAQHCRLEWVTVPLQDHQAGRFMRSDFVAVLASEADTDTFKQCQTTHTNISISIETRASMKMAPEAAEPLMDWCQKSAPQACAPLQAASDKIPIPMVPVSGFPCMHDILEASYVIFEEIAAAVTIVVTR